MKIGQFEVLTTLGSGASSTILKIRRKDDRKIYALKVIAASEPEDRKFVDQAHREFEVGSKLQHPNIVTIFAFESTKRMFRVTGARLLMEFIEGVPLTKCATAIGVPKLLKVFNNVADALMYMHREGFYHADVKPDNIMVGYDGNAKLIDLGLAWKAGESKGRVQGTLEFLAPEQAQKRIVNGRTDIFNFGATMYRAFTNKPIPKELRDKDTAQIGMKLIRSVSKVNPAVPSEMDKLVRSCLRVDPDKRPRTMREIRDEIRQIRKQLAKKRR